MGIFTCSIMVVIIISLAVLCLHHPTGAILVSNIGSMLVVSAFAIYMLYHKHRR